MSLDAIFSDQVRMRAFLPDPHEFVALLRLYTNSILDPAMVLPGIMGDTTGYMLGGDGQQVGQVHTAGVGETFRGDSNVGLVDFSKADFDVPAGLIDFTGLHIDTTAPTTGYTITNAELLFRMNRTDFKPPNSATVGTPAQLPEPSSLALLSAGLAGLALVRRRQQRGISGR